MSHYEFFCHACKKTFSRVLTLVEYEESEVLCPHCGSDDVEQAWSTFYAITTRKSA
jgi:putative FmdB family regulatory protein